jgi:hypothetical protein
MPLSVDVPKVDCAPVNALYSPTRIPLGATELEHPAAVIAATHRSDKPTNILVRRIAKFRIITILATLMSDPATDLRGSSIADRRRQIPIIAPYTIAALAYPFARRASGPAAAPVRKERKTTR